ncbi:MAG: nucleotidyltransferase family protein [Bacteroidia bacterium]
MLAGKNIILDRTTIQEALVRLNEVAMSSAVLFIIDWEDKLVGTLTDGDVRRGLLSRCNVDDQVSLIMNKSFTFLRKDDYEPKAINQIRAREIRFVPVLDAQSRIDRILDLDNFSALLPLDVIVMAGGKGERLLPLTKDTPKPLLPIGGKPIVEYNMDRLIKSGVSRITLSVRYQAQKIMSYFGDGGKKNIQIEYLAETSPLGTFGSVSLLKNLKHETLLVLNSDLLTTINFEDFYQSFMDSGADMAVATTPYHIDVPYAVFELDNGQKITSLVEKPRYTYYSNAGMYLLKKDCLSIMNTGEFMNATDFIEAMIQKNKKVISYPILGYWLDIGLMEDYQKAQEDIKHLKF